MKPSNRRELPKGIGRDGSRFFARIGINGEDIYLGCFRSLAEAVAARREGERKHHGQFAFNVVSPKGRA